MKNKHTPGPWHHDEYGHICAGPQIIGKAYQFELDDSDHDELPCIPNARLMAAAPELLEILKESVWYIDFGDSGAIEWHEQMEKLIAKIEGDECNHLP